MDSVSSPFIDYVVLTSQIAFLRNLVALWPETLFASGIESGDCVYTKQQRERERQRVDAVDMSDLNLK